MIYLKIVESVDPKSSHHKGKEKVFYLSFFKLFDVMDVN